MLEYYNVNRRKYDRFGSVRSDYNRTFLRMDYRTAAAICVSGAQIAGMLLKTVAALTFKRNPYALPR